MRFKTGQGGRPKGALNKATKAQKEFFQGILESQEYRESFRRRVLKGDPTLEQLMHHYALGKPKDTLALEGPPPMLIVDALTDVDIIALRAERDDA